MSDKSAWQLWKEKQEGDSVRPWDLLNPKIENVDKETFNDRYNLCKKCPSFLKTTGQCKKCGCFMGQKAKLPHASCPLGKWGAVQDAPDFI